MEEQRFVRGEQIRRWRMARGLSLRAFAAQVGLSYQTVQSIETGTQEPRPATLKKIADALAVPAEDLIDWGNETGKAVPVAA